MKRILKRTLTLFLAMSLLFGLLAGCTTPTSSETPTTTSARKETSGTTAGPTDSETTKSEIEQTLRLTYMTNNYNEYDFVYPWTDTGLVGNLLWLTLIQADKDLKASEGEIMSDWNVSDDGLTYTFTMREDLQWSDGTPITMDDIIWTFERYCEGYYWAYVTAALSYIEGYDAYHDRESDTISGITVDGNKLTIKLTAPYAKFLDLMAQVAPLPKHIYENCKFEDGAFKTDPIWETIKVNSGPFVVTEHVKGNYYILEPNPYYKGEESIIKKVVCTKTADVITQAQAGEVDFIGTNSVDDYEILSDLDPYRLIMVPIIYFRFLAFNFYDADGNEKPYVKDVRVRQAIAYAVDWGTIVEGLFGELANLTQSGVLANSPYYAGDWYSYDPDKAKELLDAANFDYSHTLKVFYYYTDQTTIDLMDAIAYYLEQIGVKMEAVYTANSVGDIYEGRTHDIAYFGLSAYDELSWYQMYLRANMNEMIHSIDIFKDAVKALETAYTEEKWKEALINLQLLEREHIFLLPVYTMNYQCWLHERLSVPDDCFGNNWYFYDYQFEKWEIIK